MPLEQNYRQRWADILSEGGEMGKYYGEKLRNSNIDPRIVFVKVLTDERVALSVRTMVGSRYQSLAEHYLEHKELWNEPVAKI